MGTVFSARHLRLPGKQVAVKVLHLGGQPDPDSLTRFRREAEVATRIGHPNIVEVHDFNTLPSGTPYLVLEYLVGESLAQRLQRGPLPLEEALRIARQAASALDAVHREGIVHRDLKPDNIFLVPAGPESGAPEQVKLLDFGISKVQGSQTVKTQEQVLVGTPRYMSPEQAQGKNSEVDQRTDVFALGAIVYEMLGGEPAFAAPSIAQVLFRVVYEPHLPLSTIAPGLPPNVLQAVEKALEKDPSRRYPDVRAFVADLTGAPLTGFQRASPEGGVAVPHQATTESFLLGKTMESQKHVTPLVPVVQNSPVLLASPPKPRSWFWPAMLAAVILAAGGWYLRPRSLPPPPSPPMVMPPPNPPAPTTPTKPPPPVPAVVRLTAAQEAKLKELLAPAEQALAAEDFDEAARLAKNALRELGQTGAPAALSRAYALVTRAACGKKSLVEANANFSKVSALERSAVLAYCRRFDIEPR